MVFVVDALAYDGYGDDEHCGGDVVGESNEHFDYCDGRLSECLRCDVDYWRHDGLEVRLGIDLERKN